MPRRASLGLVLCLLVNLPGAALAAIWDEDVNGDLSNNGLVPTTLNLDLGSNTIRGGFGNGDLDYIAVTVPPNTTLTGIITGVNTTVGLSKSFIGVQSGPVMTVLPSSVNAVGLLGWAHFTGADGVNVLPAIGVPKSGSTGFTPPLGPGVYTFWINETLSDPGLRFEFDFQLQATAQLSRQVPFSGSAACVEGVLLLTVAAWRRLRCG